MEMKTESDGGRRVEKKAKFVAEMKYRETYVSVWEMIMTTNSQ